MPTARVLDSYRGDASEDRAEVLTAGDGSVVLVVADGVGGRPGGGEAASRAVDLVREFAMQARSSDSFFWSRLLAHIDTLLSDEPEAGETTCVIAQIAGNGRIVGASVGDSEAWRILPGGNITVLTEDQPRKPYLGYGMARPFSFTGSLPPGGTLLLATDGLFKYADQEKIMETVLLSDLDAAATNLVDLARSCSGTLHDDITILLYRSEQGRKPGIQERIASWRTRRPNTQPGRSDHAKKTFHDTDGRDGGGSWSALRSRCLCAGSAGCGDGSSQSGAG